MTLFAAVLAGMALGASAVWFTRRRASTSESPAAKPVTRLEAHLAAPPAAVTHATAKSAALSRDMQEVLESKEASEDLAVLDRLLADVRDLSGAEEAIFWRWLPERETLIPNAWSTENEPRPVYFDVRAWGPLLRWSAEQRRVQLAGDEGQAPQLAAAPVLSGSTIYGALSVSSASGLALDREGARTWLPRFAAQLASLLQLFDLRRDYGRQMRQSEALLDAVQRLHGHRTAEALAQALCDTASDVTSAPVAGVVRWNDIDQLGVVQAVSPGLDIEGGFHVTADSLVGRACMSKLPIVMDDARAATSETCPYGGSARPVGSFAVVPIVGTDHSIGAIIVEGQGAGDVGPHEARNVGLLAAVARGPLEIIWEIEEVSRRARTDALTGLANRRHFDEQLRRVVAETDRFGGTCSLILADIDHFKSINDQHGHDAGDAVLKHVAQLMSDAVRAVDMCARYGGEEIAILLPQTSETGAAELAERLRVTLESRPISRNGQPVRATASFGIATYPSPVPQGDWLVLAADKALYAAKAAGRNCVKVVATNHVTPALYRGR